MHDDYTLLMSLVLDGEATSAEEARLRSHVRGCDTCAATWQRWQELDRRFDAAPVVPAPAGLAELVLARVAEGQAVRRQGRRFAFWLGLAWAIALVLAGFVAFAAANWPAPLPGGLGVALSALVGVAAWVWRIGVEVYETAGLPVVAATAGATLCLTCVLAVAWLWIVNHGVGVSEPAPSVA